VFQCAFPIENLHVNVVAASTAEKTGLAASIVTSPRSVHKDESSRQVIGGAELPTRTPIRTDSANESLEVMLACLYLDRLGGWERPTVALRNWARFVSQAVRIVGYSARDRLFTSRGAKVFSSEASRSRCESLRTIEQAPDEARAMLRSSTLINLPSKSRSTISLYYAS